MMETDSLQSATFMYFWFSICDENHVEGIPVAGHIFHLASERLESDTLHLFLLFDGTRIDEDEYLSSLEAATELLSAQRNRSRNCRSTLN